MFFVCFICKVTGVADFVHSEVVHTSLLFSKSSFLFMFDAIWRMILWILVSNYQNILKNL